MFNRRVLSVLLLTLALLLALTAWAFAQGGATVQVAQHPTFGKILVDADGMTLYVFAKDQPGVSNCYDQCAKNWPPLTVAAGETPTAGPGVSGTLGVIKRKDGRSQVTYNGMPLYRFFKDQKPGDANGQGIKGVWFVVNPAAPSVTVNNQPIKNGTVTVARVVAFEPGWIVIHANANGKPGPILGYTAVKPGENLNVVVKVNQAKATARLHAMLHVDRGTRGTFEFPGGADVPVKVSGKVVNVPFNVTATVLPTTGATPFPWTLWAAFLGGLALLAGVGLRFALRSR
jgi:Uncharacterized protein conserved in bacteria